MNIKVLQGCNLQSDSTTVVLELEKVCPELLDRFKKLHAVFMKSYLIKDDKTVSVETNIPHLWKNEDFVKPIEDCATGRKSFEEAESEMMEISKLILGSMTTIPLLEAAHSLGYETLQLYINRGILDKKGWNLDYSVGIGSEQRLFHSASSSRDSSTAKKTQENKILTNQFIEQLGIPIAKWKRVESKDQLPKIAEDLGFPLVMKPTGLTGGHGVQIGMKNLEELEAAWDRIQYYYAHEMKFPDAKASWQKEILVQRVLRGNDYRLLVIDGILEIATHRVQARVVGDGKNTVEELIEIENKNPARDIRLPTHTLKPIIIDEDIKKVLSKQNLSLSYVPKKDEIVRVRDVASMSQGGITIDVTDKICPQIRYMAESIARSIHAFVLGVDILCQDITKPLTLDNGGIIEMNTMPEMYLNTYPVEGRQYPEVNIRMVQSLMKGSARTNKVVVLGDIPDTTISEILSQEFKNAHRIGTLRNGAYSINNELININLTTHEGVLCLKKNASLDTIVIHYDTEAEVEENGFGFNTIDLFVCDEDADAKTKARINELKSKSFIHKLITL